MADVDRLRPIEPAPLAPLRERPRRRNEHDFDLQRELSREHDEEPDEPQSEDVAEALEAPVAPRGEDEAGGRVDLTA